jgi:hypothetical protein
MVKIFTMVKDESDIVRDWVIYHGCMFGWDSIFVIDNYSSDGTWEILNEFSDLIKIFREYDYKQKGVYMTNLINQYCNNEIAFPIDIDEFIVYYDNNKVYVDKENMKNYFNNLPIVRVYKANYINPLITNENGYERCTVECSRGLYFDMGDHAKSFIHTTHFKDTIDHGNHINCNDYHLTKICLVHYHSRNLEQIKKKIINNVIGLGHENNLDYLKNLINTNPLCDGNHHVTALIRLLENTYLFNVNCYTEDAIDLTDLQNIIAKGFF